MKLLGRIVIILLAALAISGATYELGQAGMLSTVVGIGQGGGRAGSFTGQPNQAPGSNAAASGQRQPRAEGDQGGRDAGGFSLFGLSELGKAFLTTALVIVVIAPIVSLIQWRRRSLRKARINSPNASA